MSFSDINVFKDLIKNSLTSLQNLKKIKKENFEMLDFMNQEINTLEFEQEACTFFVFKWNELIEINWNNLEKIKNIGSKEDYIIHSTLGKALITVIAFLTNTLSDLHPENYVFILITGTLLGLIIAVLDYYLNGSIE